MAQSSKRNEVASLPLPGIPGRRGRPVTGKALTPAERQRRYREKQALKVDSANLSFKEETDSELLNWLVKAGPKLQEKAWIEFGRRKGWKLP